MERFSVKKPFTILVAVIAVIVLGIVSFTKMPLDLLPELSLPYLMVITTYPGASPEKVRKEISEPVENALGTVSNVENVYSVSSENFSMVQLEFVDGTNMDSAMVKVSSAIDQLNGNLPDTASTPTILELSMDMLATAYVGIERADYDIYELSDYVERSLLPYMERQEGVASVSAIGLVDRTVEVRLNKKKIDALNSRLQKEAREKLDDAEEQLNDALDEVEKGQKQLESQESSFGATLAKGVFGALDGPVKTLSSAMKSGIGSLIGRVQSLQSSAEGINRMSETARSAAQDAQNAFEEAQSDVQTLTDAVQKAQEDYQKAMEDLAAATQEAAEEAIPGLQEAADLAAQALQEAQSDLTAARARMEEAAAKVAETASQAVTTIDEAGIREEVEGIVADLQAASSVLDGGSLSSLMSAATKLGTVMPRIQALISRIRAMDTGSQMADPISSVTAGLWSLQGSVDRIPSVLDSLEAVYGGLTQAQLSAAVGFSTAASQLIGAQSQLKSAQTQFEQTREQAMDAANLDALLSMTTLSSMIYAQNFSMPAGYISDANDNSWLLKIGDEFESSDDIAQALLCDIDPVGTVRLDDVADITVTDNAGKSYASLNGNPAILMAVYKGSSAGTNEVSRNIAQAMGELEERDEGLHMVTLMDQGSYISIIVGDILRSMGLGALLAILILALFLKDVRPTLVVGISIPLSVMCALLLMYFSGLSLNIMTLSGLSLGIGMLVDNSIVVMENIFRLRGRGLAAPRAAVQGARQVSGSIIASTLTTVCVFAPMVFTKGTVRSLLVPLALSISYCLLASLIVAMSVVPAAGSTLLRNASPKKNRFMEKVQAAYAKSLRWCLSHKLIPLAVASLLLAVCIARLVSTGIVVLPEMNGDDIQVTVRTPEGLEREDSYARVDQVMEAVKGVDGVGDVGIMDSGSTVGLLGSFGGSSDTFGSYLCYVRPEDGAAFSSDMDRICADIEEAVSGIDAEITVSNGGGMSDTSALLSSGLSINIYGTDLDRVEEIAEDVRDMVRKLEGVEEVSEREAQTEAALHLIIDKDKAMSYGLTVAQIYGQIAARLSTSVTSTSITVGDSDYDVLILDETDPLTRENLMDMEFDSASAMSAAGMGGMGGAMGGSSMGGGSASAMMAMMGGASSGESTGDEEEEKEETVHKLHEFAILETTDSLSSIRRKNLTGYLTVSASLKEGYNTTLLSRELQKDLDAYETPRGYTIEIEGEASQVRDMLKQMIELILLAFMFIYMVMVAEFQSLLSPFIIIFTIPLAFTGGMLGLIAAGEQLSLLSLMGFAILMGTVVNNGIVFVDYANELRKGGLERRDALVSTGLTRMRPILMTALTTILAMSQLIFGSGMGSQMGRGMAIVIAGGLIYGTLMTLYIIPIMYDILFRRQPRDIDTGDDMDEVPDDAAEFLEQLARERAAEA